MIKPKPPHVFVVDTNQPPQGSDQKILRVNRQKTGANQPSGEVY